MGAAVSKSLDSCLMCICLGDNDSSRFGYDDDGEDDPWQNLRQRRLPTLRQNQSVDALLQSSNAAAAAAAAAATATSNPGRQQRGGQQQTRDERQGLAMRSHSTRKLGRKLSEGVRRIGSLQEEIDWIERERKKQRHPYLGAPSKPASSRTPVHPVIDTEPVLAGDFFVSTGSGASSRRFETQRVQAVTVMSAEEGLQRPSLNPLIVSSVVSKHRRVLTGGVPRSSNNNVDKSLNNKRSTSPPTAWHWPATRPATPNSEVCLSSTTTSTRDPSPTIALRNGVLVNAAPTHDSVLEDGLASFFHSDGDELMEDKTWCQPRKAPSLAELLGRVELLGNVDVALSEIRSMQDEETRREEIIRGKVMARFMQVMGPKGPGLAVKKCHRGGRGSAGIALGAKDRGRWAERTIRFEPISETSLLDGTPLGGCFVWNSRRLFPREQPGVDLADISKAEHSGKFVWITADGEGKLGLETHCSADARFLCRSIDFLVSATLQQQHQQSGECATEISSKERMRSASVVTDASNRQD